MFGPRGFDYDRTGPQWRGSWRNKPAEERGKARIRLIEQEKDMSSKAIFACVLVAFVAACAAKEEVVYTEAPVTTEPVYTGKYGS